MIYVLQFLGRMGPSSMTVPNLKRRAHFVQKLLRGPKISKLGHVTINHAPFEPETLNSLYFLPNFTLLALSITVSVSHGSCKGDAASQWEMAILGVSELRNP